MTEQTEALDAIDCLHTHARKTAATDSFYQSHNVEMDEHMRTVSAAIHQQAARIAELEKGLREKTDFLHLSMQLLGPKGRKVVQKLMDDGGIGFHASWGPGMWELSGEQRSEALLAFIEAPATPLDFNDSHLPQIELKDTNVTAQWIKKREG